LRAALCGRYDSKMARAILFFACLVASSACAAPMQPPKETAASADAAQVEPSSVVQPHVIAEPAIAPMPEPAPESVTGIAACDAYLAAYQRCEKMLEPSIAAGDARTFRAEAARLVYLKGTPEAAGLAQSCDAMLRGLHAKCAP